ncbi:RluA family pseudouridine synthase [Candidatus Uzinura diaspidicola str. ASNER]|uniref:Pseudouridine synthase n=1 Tax=Candidatus Uzinura diaspidicola str. ASNER TaxID=1133592 RepID=L7VJI4_9FLAO|nr:RluA family pseudouridine synthase [Candidatus Uzinura diaspidicola str. ASNER]
MNNKHYSFIVDKNQKPLRIDKFLLNSISNTTRNKIKNTFYTEKIFVNNFLVKKNYRVKPLDVISVMMDSPKEILLEDISLNIIYEDDVLVVINKPSGLAVHPGYGNYKATLLHAIKYYLNKIGIVKIPERIGLVHRLDKETSGLLLIAKNDFSLQHLTYQFFTRSVYRRYLALVWGNLEGYGTIKGNIGRSLIDRKRMEIFSDATSGKHSVTHYKVLEKLNIVTLVSCRIDTGRTHQIRTHFTNLGNPIFNDPMYGGRNKNCLSILQGQFLHAQSFIFIHPITGKPMHFEVPLSKDMYEVLEILRNSIIQR